jgi:uncharacterized membrane protein YvlD (DUF360 family)
MKIVRRAIVVLLLDAAALLVLSSVLERFTIDRPATALVLAAIVGLLNGLVWPVLARFTLPLSVLTLGLGSLVLNAGLFALAASVLPGVQIGGWLEAIVVVVALTALTTMLSTLLAVDDDESWHRNVVRRQARRRGDHEVSDVPGVVFLEIDGLGHEVLRRALRDGNAPTLASWLREGSHDLERWETDWSSQTGACQAGLLHGDSHDIPAFRWWEKDLGRAIVTNHPRDAEEIERRHSDGHGLLHAGGASRANIVSGDAEHSLLTMSTVLQRRPGIGRDYAAYFAQPYAVVRTFLLSLVDIARERAAMRRERRDDVQPRLDRGWTYALVRAWATVIQRDLQVAAVIGDMLAGRAVVYSTFLAYDEVAHHSGIERPETLEVLRQVDRQLARVAAAIPDAPRPYRLVVLSDHGQSQGATFLQRYEQTLEDLVRESCETADVAAPADGSEAGAYLDASVSELATQDTAVGRVARGAAGRRQLPEADEELPDLVVMASGNLASIVFPREPGRVTLERLEQLHPRLVPALREHPGIGFLLVRSERDGAVVLGKSGVHWLEGDRVEGEDPLAPFGPRAADHVRRTDAYPHCPDVVLNSTWWEDAGEVAAFEELVGSHGGMGGPQGFPFVFFPADLAFPDDEVVGPDAMHRVLRGWLAAVGQKAYADGGRSSDSPG